MTTTTAASNTNEPPCLFLSLPNDLVLNVLARVPRRYHQTLSCVSKSLRSLVNSSELRMTRSLLGKDVSLYVGFVDSDAPCLTHHWFSLSGNQNRLVSIPFPCPPQSSFSALMVGAEIYLVGGYCHHDDSFCKSMWILDSRSGKMRQGPSMLVARYFAAVGLVEEKIYVCGGFEDKYEEIQAEVFDPKKQTWQVAPNPGVEDPQMCMSVVNPSSLGGKIYATYVGLQVIVYDPRDGKCEKIDSPVGDDYDLSDVCVIDHVLYIYKSRFGLMWYDSKEKEWRVVNGLNLSEDSPVNKAAMAEYNGKLALLRQHWGEEKKKKEIWCAMISLDTSGIEIMGKVDWNDHLLSIPGGYTLKHCLHRTD